MSPNQLKNSVILFLIITAFLGCKNDDDSSDNSEIKTYWLERYTPNTIIGEDPIIYEEQNILWTFDFQSNTLIVEILNGAEPVLLDSGTYNNFINLESSCDNGIRQVIINNVYYGHLFFNNNNQPPIITLEDLCFTSRSLLFQEI